MTGLSVAISAAALPYPAVAQETTNAQTIDHIQYNGATQTLFFVGSVKWSTPNCPSATYVQITSDVPGQKEILSIGLAAKMAGQKVQFWGQCDTNTDYFDAFYIVLEPQGA